MAPSGLYARLCQAFLDSLFSSLGKLAERAIYFTNVFLYFFNGRHSTSCFSESNEPIFTKISGLVDGWKGLLISFSFLRSVNGRCHGNQLNSKNRRFSQTKQWHLLRQCCKYRHIMLNISEYLGLIWTSFTGLASVLVGMIIPIFVWWSPKGRCYDNQLNLGDVRRHC